MSGIQHSIEKCFRLLFGFSLMVFSFVVPSWAQPEGPHYEVAVSKYLMGTRIEATVMHGDVNEARRALVGAFVEMERVEQRLSVHIEQSEISKINSRAGRNPVRVSLETFALLQRAQHYAEKYEGLFDVSIGPITALWGFSGTKDVTLPDSSVIDSLLGFVNFRNIVMNEQDTTVFLAQVGMQLDLGGVAKGYAVDRAVLVLREQGIANFLLNAGGDIYVSGMKSGDQAWNVGVKHPRVADALIATLDLRDMAVATSGDYERFVDLEGRRYHHIMDPRTGFPAALNQSVTVLAPTSEEADALATYLFIMGLAQNTEKPHKVQHFIGVDAQGQVHFDPFLVEHHALTILP